MLSVESLLDDLFVEILAGILLLIAGSIFGYFYKVQIRDKLKRIIAWLSNAEVQVQISRIDKFEDPPQGDIGMTLFDQIQDEYPDVENAGIAENRLRIRANNIPTVLEIRIEAERDFDNLRPDIVGYKLVTETYSDLRFGYRSYGSLEKFENMSEDIADIIRTELFTGQHPNQSYILSKFKGGIPSGMDSIEDDELGISGEVQDSTLQMTIETPQNLTKGVRRYYRPT